MPWLGRDKNWDSPVFLLFTLLCLLYTSKCRKTFLFIYAFVPKNNAGYIKKNVKLVDKLSFS